MASLIFFILLVRLPHSSLRHRPRVRSKEEKGSTKNARSPRCDSNGFTNHMDSRTQHPFFGPFFFSLQNFMGFSRLIAWLAIAGPLCGSQLNHNQVLEVAKRTLALQLVLANLDRWTVNVSNGKAKTNKRFSIYIYNSFEIRTFPKTVWKQDIETSQNQNVKGHTSVLSVKRVPKSHFTQRSLGHPASNSSLEPEDPRSCVLVSKSLRACRLWSCCDFSPKGRFTITPRFLGKFKFHW